MATNVVLVLGVAVSTKAFSFHNRPSSNLYERIFNEIFTKFSAGVGHGWRNNELDFVGDPDFSWILNHFPGFFSITR